MITAEAHSCFIIFMWPLTSQKSRRWCLNRLGSNLRQSWRQAVVAMVALAGCIQLFWSVQSSLVHSPVQSSPVQSSPVQSSPVHSSVQSRVQVLQRPV